MTNLTKKQRREIYLKVAEIISIDCYDGGMCLNIRLQLEEIAPFLRFPNYSPIFKVLVPEFTLLYPNGKSADKYWDVDTNDRVIIMLLCAEMCR